MTFLKNCALLLPAGYLVSALSFLLTHGRTDPAFSGYPFLNDWLGAPGPARSPELSFLAQTGVLFLVPYVLWLLLVALVGAAEGWLWAGPRKVRESEVRRIYSLSYTTLFLVLAGMIGASAPLVRERLPADFEAGPILISLGPFLSGVLSVIPALVVAVPAAGFIRMKR